MNKASIVALVGALTLSSSAFATLTFTGPFTGSESETFEGFSNYINQPGSYLSEGSAIFGGNATISSLNQDMVIYQPDASALFGLASSDAQVADGEKGLGLNSEGDTLSIAFASPISAFGGYFGSANGGGYSGNITFNFSDGSSDQVNFSDPNDTGALDWMGWTSDVGLTSVDVSGDYLVADGLQANAQAPDRAASLFCFAAALLALAGFRRAQRTAGA